MNNVFIINKVQSIQCYVKRAREEYSQKESANKKTRLGERVMLCLGF